MKLRLLIFFVIVGLLSYADKKPGSGVTYAMASTAFLDSRRKAYLNAVAALQADNQYIVNNTDMAIKQGKKNIRVAQSYVCSEIPMTPTSSSYVLNVIDQQYNVGNNNLLPAERRIKQQDVFFTYALGLYIRMTNGWQGLPFILQTFPTAAVNGPAPAFYPDVSTLQGIWTDGTLTVTVNGDVLTPAWDLSQHLVIPQSQANPGGVPVTPYQDQLDLSEYGQVITEPNWIINGGNNNIYQITYPNNYGNIFGGVNAASTGITSSIVMKWYGFLAQNASSIMNNAPAKGA